MSKSRSLLGVSAVLLLLAVVSSPAPLQAATYAITVATNAPTYTGTQPIIVTGAVSPAPGPNTGVVVTITNPSGMIVDIDEVSANATTGKYTFTSIPGGSSYWVAGTFGVNATWGGEEVGGGAVATAATTFAYAPAVTTTSTTTTSTTTSTTTTTTSTSTTSSTTTSTTTPVTTASSTTSTTTTTTTSSSTTTTPPPPPPPPVTTTSTTTSTSSTVPEFPTGVLALVTLLALAAVALLSRRAVGADGLASNRR